MLDQVTHQALRELSFAEAIREGLDQSMAQDARVVVIGEGVPDPKAIFGTTAGLRQRYGAARVFDMPLSENGMTGICIGAALSGMRPVMVHQRIDFALLAMDQLVNNAAKWHYMFDGKATVPLVVRVIVGRGWGQGPQHAQSLQGLFAQIPGLKVVMPTTAHDAKGMLIAAIEDPNPVIFIEHRWLHHLNDHVPHHAYRVPLDRARILHGGSDLTVAAFSYMAIEALQAARALAPHNLSIEVIDMRSARPLDIDSVLTSVRKTGHLLVADTAGQTSGLAAEVVSQVVERGFKTLAVAPRRITTPDHPVPTSHFMSKNYYPDALTMADTILTMLGKSKSDLDYPTLQNALKRSGPEDIPNQNFSGPF
jgi:pyruvate/2-oxoglutarate/acetoin dehydrogenase E1 component